MANSEIERSSDAARALGGKYQVFLSFRGPDTRYGFTDFLYHGLVDAGVHVFRDDDELRFGEVIGENLLCAIDDSIIYISIFSQTYASSKWCLRELVHMVESVSKSKGKKSIFPIFFNVEPEDVKLKTPHYREAFLKHEKEFPNEVQAWREALAEADEIKGWIVKKDQSQATTVKLIVEKVLEKLEIKQKPVTEYLVGLDDRVKDLTELLDVNHRDVRLIVIYGMGGIGKTTVAKVIFNNLSSHFGKCCSFLEDVRESSSNKEGIAQLQKKLVSDIVGSESAEKLRDIEQGMRRIGEILCTKKVLVVLDDVDNKEHIRELTGNSSLHSGSRLIITTRSTSILKVEGFKGEILPYEMLKMNDGLALQLFCRHAFGKDFPSDDYHGISSEIISSMGGLPLAIKVTGSLLNRKDKAFWEETMVRLKNVPEKAILEKLKISYDDLDEYQKQIFLDIACFFLNETKTDAIYMWADCQSYPERGIDVLTSRCLVKILDNDKFWMHDQLIDLGRQIVRQESPSDLGKQSRLWIAKEALEIIRTREEKDKVQALEIDGLYDSIEIKNEEFQRLQNLRCLKLCEGTYTGDFAECRSKLRWISWHPPRQGFGAYNMYLVHLVVFKLGMNDFTNDSKAWDLIKRAQNLKVLSLTKCDGITTIPDFSKCLGLERLTLARCNRLKRIQNFIGDLQSLIELEIEGCMDLTNLPDEVGALVKLKRFSLRRCCKLRELPNSLGNLTSLVELDLSRTGIAKIPNSIKRLVKLESFLMENMRISDLPNSIGNLKSLRVLRLSKEFSYSEHHVWQFPSGINILENLGELDLFGCDEMNGEIPDGIGELSKEFTYSEHHVWQLPSGINILENLEELDFSGRDEMIGEIPVGIGELSSLRILNLERTRICGIPRTINMLHHLQTLNLRDCHGIQELPELPKSLTCLLLRSESLLSVPNLSNLTNLVELLLSDGSRNTGKSNLIRGCNIRWIGMLSRLKKLELNLLKVLAPQELASLSHLEELTLSDLNQETLMQLPSSLLKLDLKVFSFSWAELHPSYLRLSNLSTLELYYGEVEDIPLNGLPRLENLTVDSCKLLQNLSIPMESRMLRQACVSSCPDLVEIKFAGLSESLECLNISMCESLSRIDGLSYLKKLEDLAIRKCNALTNVEGVNELESLKWLVVEECMSLRRLIDKTSPNIPDDCLVTVQGCGDFIKDSTQFYQSRFSFKRYREDILQGTSNKIDHPFRIIFHLGVKKSSEGFEFVGEIKRETEVASDTVTYEGLIAGVKGFDFHPKRMWYESPGKDHELLVEIEGDEQVKEMVQQASERGSIHVYVEGRVDFSLGGAMIKGNQWDCPVHFLSFLFVVLFFLWLSWTFPGKQVFWGIFGD
ncbi:TMV resistance protein N-like [Syzygium oleosum]|uniref:TMV resistance protein N-like n=1 Tax=Syzygium oleosum TaxID=219896 RepID=UPI0011D1CE2D|nr:TMV resistance protein N-like [Syzygium oleosum]